MRGLTNPGEMTWTYRDSIVRSAFDEVTVVDKIRSAIEDNRLLHLVPSARNFPAVDSIVYYPADVLTCIQFTIKSELVNTQLLSRVSSVLKDGSHLEHCLQLSALAERGRGDSYLLCRQIWRLLSDCRNWKMILTRVNGLWASTC